MSVILDAVYENGLVRILEPVRLREAQRLKVLIPQDGEGDRMASHRFLTTEEVDGYFPESDRDEPAPSLEDVRSLWAKVSGSMSDAVVEERDAKW